MSIRKTIIAAVAGLALVAAIAPVSASAVTVEELQATINGLLAQLALLQGTTTTTGTSTYTACAGVTFSGYLRVGSVGQDVKCLQQIMNGKGYTVATTGAGSPGNETTYFGSRTLQAVQQWQAAQGWVIASQVGPKSIALLNSIVAGSSTTTGTGTGTGTTTPTGAGLTVSLASDNPAAGTVVDTQGLATLAKINFYNGDNAEVKITNLKLKRIGIAADSTLGNVYLFEGAKRLTDSASVASTIVTFNDSTGVITIPAGSSKTISVLADVDGSVGELVGVQVTSAADVTSNSSAVKGTFPITGNLFTLASGTNLATMYFAGGATPTAASIDPQNDYAIWYDNVVVGTRAVNLSRIAFKVGGSVTRSSDVKNFRLLIDGVQQGSAVANADSNDYVTFDLSAAPVKMETGTRVVKVLVDIIGGSNKNVYLSLRTAADVSVVDSQMNANLKVTKTNTSTTFTALDGGTQSINSGSLTVTKLSTSPSGNVVDGANNVVLAKFELKAAGERVKIESMKVSATVSDLTVGQLRNGALYANGVQVGSTADIEAVGDSHDTTNEYTTFNFGSSLIVDPGSPVTLEVRADIYDNDGTNGINANDTVRINLEGSASENNAYGLVSMATVDVPATDTTGNTVTVKNGTLTLALYGSYANHSVVAPLTNYKLGHFTLTADTTEAVNINTITATLDAVSTYVSNLYVKFGANTTNIKPTISTPANSWSVNYSVAAGQTVDVMVYGDVSSGMSSSTGQVTLTTTGTTASSAVAVGATGATDIAGQTLTFGTGSLTPAFANTPLAGVVAGGQQVLAGKFKITAANDSYTITEMQVKVGSAAIASVINSAILKIPGETTPIRTRPFDTTSNTVAYFTGLSIPVAANATKYIDVYLDLAVPSATNSTDYKNVAVTLDQLKYLNSQGTVTESTSLAKAGSAQYVYKSFPTFTVGTLNSATAASGSQAEVYKFTVGADAKGDIALKQLKFDIKVSDGGTASVPRISNFKFFRGSTDITSSVNIVNAAAADIEGATSISSGSGSTSFYINWTTSDTEETISAGSSYTYSIKATLNDFYTSNTGNDSVSVNLSSDDSTDVAKHFLVQSSTTGIYGLHTSSSSGSGAVEAAIWSDFGATSHTAAVDDTAAKDWVSGYLINNLPLDVRAVTAQ